MNWSVLIISAVICIAIVVFTFRKNSKDEKEFEEQSGRDYPKPHHDRADADPEETTR